MKFWIVMAFAFNGFMGHAQEFVFEEVSSPNVSKNIDFGHVNLSVISGYFLQREEEDLSVDGTYLRSFAWEQFEVSLGAQTEGGRFHLYETFLGLKQNGLEMRVGQQIINWARIDFFSSFESINTTNFENPFIRETKYQKSGNPLLYTSYGPLHIFYAPKKHVSYLPDEDSKWSFFQNSKLLGIEENSSLKLLQYENESEIKRESSYGARLQKDLGQSDFAISVVKTTSQIPTYILKGSKLVPLFPKVQIVGGDFSTSISSYVLRGELSFTNNLLVTKKDFSKVETMSTNAAFNLEGNLLESAWKIKITMAYQLLDTSEIIYEMKEELTGHYEVEKLFLDEKLTLNVGILNTFNDPSYGFFFKAKYNLNDTIQLSLKASSFGGKGRGPLAFYDINRALFAQVENDL